MQNNKSSILQLRKFHGGAKSSPNIGIATVYRTLELLSNLDILYKTTFDEGKYRYELSDANDNHQHHHVICPCLR